MKKQTLYILLLFTFIACSKEEEEESMESTIQHESVVVNTNKWETITTSDFIISGRWGYSFESDINYELGGVENASPTFLGKHSFYRSGGPEGPYSKMHVVSRNELLHYDLPLTLRDESGSQLPASISGRFSTGRVDQVQNRIFRNGGLWSQGTLLDDRFGGPYIIDDATILKNETETIGWMNYVNYNDFPSGYVAQGTTNEVQFSNIGTLDIIEINGNRFIYFMATFNNNSGGSGNQRAIMCRKNWNSQKIEIDDLSILPHSSSIAANAYPEFKTIAFNESEIFSIYVDIFNKEIEVYKGNIASGFQLLQTITNSDFESLVKGKNEFFIIYRDSNSTNETKSIKFSKDGISTNLGAIEYGKYSHYNGNLIVGVNNNLNEIQVIEVTGNGTRNILAAVGDIDVGPGDGVIYRGNELMEFASDGSNLFVALKNWKSPKYRGKGGQFGGIEIIKHKK